METIKKADGFHESVDGPDDETKYILHKDRLPSNRYHELARTITEAVLDVSPREVATVGVQGIDDFLRDRNEEAVKTLLKVESRTSKASTMMERLRDNALRPQM